MADTRVLIVTPLKGDISRHYSKTLIELLNGHIDGFELGHVFMTGNCVMGARDWGAYKLEQEGWDKLIFWDADLNPSPADFVRLLAHKEDFVCAPYCKRETDTNWHFFPISPETGILPNGLWQMNQAAIGFSSIDKSVFARIKTCNPWLTYTNQEQGVGKTQLHQYFPWQIVGPNSDMGKLRRITDHLNKALSGPHNSASLLAEMASILADDDHSQNLMQGEDYGFCRMAREAGVKIWLDTKLIVPHLGECSYPIAHDNLVRMIAEPWRQDHWAEIKAKQAANKFPPQ